MLGFYPRPWALAGALALVSFHGSLAEETADDETLIEEKIVVTAHRHASPEEAVGSSVSVLDGDLLAAHGFAQVAEALRLVPGLEVSRTGGAGQVTSVFLRGGSSSQTLVLLDGVRLNSATSGAFDFGDLGLEEIERIEVVRGPQSTLYGSEAAAGVIQLFTRRGTRLFAAQALGELGEGEYHRLHLGASGANERFDWRLSGTDDAVDAVSAADERRGHREKDGHAGTRFSGGFGLRLGAAETAPRLDVQAYHAESESELDGFAFPAGPVDDLDALLERRASYARATVAGALTPSWRQRLELGVADDDLFGSDPTDPFGTYRIDSRNLSLGTQADVERGRHLWTVGVVREERRGGSIGSFEEEVKVDAAYLQDVWQLGEKATLSLGLRHDDHSAFGGETTGRAALAWQLREHWRLRASWGTGFKAPTLNDLYFPFFGNSALVPESSRAVDIGLEVSLLEGRLGAELTYFDQVFDDLIAFDFVTFLPQNIASASSRGVEAALRWRSPEGRIVANLAHTWNETADDATGLPLARRPESRTVLDLAWRPQADWRIAAVVIAVSDRIDSDLAPLEDYERLDLALSWLGAARFEPGVRLLNVFDDDNSEVGGFSAQPRAVIAGLRVNF